MTDQSVRTRTIDWPGAAKAVQAAVAMAKKLNVLINVAVVDRSGILAAFLRMPGAPLHSVEISIDKAYTSASFGLPTSQWDAILSEHSAMVKEGLLLRPRFVAFGGGVPIYEEGFILGGIGVSGASEQQDEQCARAGLIAIGLDSHH